MAQNSRKGRAPSGWTLIEILVVIAIISIISAIVLPVVAQARKSAMQTTCLMHIRQHSHALQMYLADNEDRLPEKSRSWSEMISPYGAVNLKCPSFRQTYFRLNAQTTGYSFNVCLFIHGRSPYPYDASRTVAFNEVTEFYYRNRGNPEENEIHHLIIASAVPDVVLYRFLQDDPMATWRAALPFGAERHRGGSNYAMMDGRGVWLKPERIRFPNSEREICNPWTSARWIGPVGGVQFIPVRQ